MDFAAAAAQKIVMREKPVFADHRPATTTTRPRETA